LIDLNTVSAWLRDLGWSYELEDESTLRVVAPAIGPSQFFIRCAGNWLLLAIVGVLDPSAKRPGDLARRLLAVNRDMRIAKFAYDEDGDVTLTAELPTESLCAAELRDVLQRMPRYVDHYRGYLTAEA
jgi:hypothetical protein